MYLFANRFGCWFISVILVICTISCSQPKQEIKKNEEVIKETLIQMWDAIENEDLDRYASYIHPNFTEFGEFDDKLKIGKDRKIAMVGYFGPLVRNFEKMEVALEILDISRGLGQKEEFYDKGWTRYKTYRGIIAQLVCNVHHGLSPTGKRRNT